MLLVVPLFHVNAWGIPYAAAMCGAKLVLPGPSLDGKSIFDLAAQERCNFSLGVPTVWLGFFKYIEDNPDLDLSAIKLERVVIGGSAAPRAIVEKFRDTFDVFVIHAWGMSETSPLATIGNLLPKHRDLPRADQVSIQTKQGRAIYGVELKIVDEDGTPLPHDGSAAGDLMVRGPWVTSGYFKAEGGERARRAGLVRDRRRRHHRFRRLRPDHRPLEGRDQVRRRVDQLDRSRKHRGRASRRSRRRRSSGCRIRSGRNGRS